MSSTPNATKRRLVDYEDTPSSTPTSSGTTTPTQVRKVAAEMSGMGVNGAPTPQRRPLQRENSEPKGLRISKSDVLKNGSSTNNNGRPQPSSSSRILQKVTFRDHRLPSLSSEAGPESSLNGRSNGPFNGQPNVLPVQQHKEKIVGAIFDHPTTIFVGETGSGKSTLIPQLSGVFGSFASSRCFQFVLDYILKPGEQVAVTQPRRVAAFSLAKKVAEDRKVELGQKVGYKFRFENVTSPKTRLTYMTDGMLLKEFANNPRLSQYSCIVLDEVHERSMASDVLLFILRKIQKARKKRPLKLVLMSATIDAEELCAYFDDAPAFSIPGRTFPVRIFYTQIAPTKFQEDGQADLALRTVRQMHELQPIDESFLVFLTGQDEIEGVCRVLRQEMDGNPKPMRVVPFYAQAKEDDVQKTVFAVTPDVRKVVVATNIAETSITIPDIKVVIDGGKVKQKIYLPSKRTNTLSVVPTSRSQAIQRAGRAGRVSPGCCFRLYTKDDYERMDTDVVPEIKRSNLSEVLMNLISVGIKVPNDIDLLDNPKKAEWCHALDELYMLDLIDFTNEPGVYQITKEAFLRTDLQKKMGLGYELTEKGSTIRRLPVSPMLGRFLQACYERHCLVEGLIVAACCSVEDFVVREELLDDKTRQEQRQLMKACYSPDNDHFRLVKIYRHFKKQSVAFAKGWCERSGFHYRRLEEVHRIRGQLRDECAKLGWNQDHDNQSVRPKEELLKLALAESHFVNAAFQDNQNKFTLSCDKNVHVKIHPTSCLNRSYPSAFVFSELLRTNGASFARTVTSVDKQLLRAQLSRFGLPNHFFRTITTSRAAMNNMNMPMGQPNVGMNMAGRLGPPQFQQQPEQNTLHVTYQDPAWPPNQINEHNVLNYFCNPLNSVFYERTSDNEQLRMQANLIQGGAQEMEANLQRMTGIQYVLHKSRPPLFVIRKQKRNGPFQVQPLCYYYVLNGIVHQAPDLYSVVNSRLIGAVEPLKTALSSVVDMLQLNSTKGTYSWKFTEPTKRSKKAAEEADANAEAWNSRPTPYQHSRTGMLLRILQDQMQESAAANAENAASSDPVQP